MDYAKEVIQQQIDELRQELNKYPLVVCLHTMCEPCALHATEQGRQITSIADKINVLENLLEGFDAKCAAFQKG